MRESTMSRSRPSASASHVVPQYSAIPSMNHRSGIQETTRLCSFITAIIFVNMYQCVSSCRVTHLSRAHEPLCGNSTRPLMSSVSPPTDSLSSSGVAFVCWKR